jgi:RNA polymerase sigma factor (TIGR02999 family)
MPAGMELLRTTPLEFRSGTPPGRPWEAVSMNDVTRILSAIGHGDPKAAGQLLPLVYDELRALAARKLAREKPGQTLQATALVHEAYLRLVDKDEARRWESRAHFFAAAAEAMRRILVDNARRKRRPKHGGDRRRIDLDGSALLEDVPPSDDLIALDEALTKLAAEEPVKAKLVQLRYFAGLTVPQAAELLGLSTATAERYWTYARTWLYCALKDPGSAGERRRKPAGGEGLGVISSH